MFKRTIILTINAFIPHRISLAFFSGFFLSLAIFFNINSSYNNDLYSQLGQYINEESDKNGENPFEKMVRAMNVVYNLQKDNIKYIFHYTPNNFKAKYMRSSDLDLLDVSGRCGSSSYVLAETLKNMGFPIRIGQMIVDGKYGGHMLVEAWHNGRWSVLDPSYNQYFYRPDSTLASFNDVSNNFNSYKKQLKPNYEIKYAYEGVRYTNWDKFGEISQAAKYVLIAFYGKTRVERFSVRKYLINFDKIWATIFYLISFFLILMSLIQWWLKRYRLKYLASKNLN